jgi:hypothetical protein
LIRPATELFRYDARVGRLLIAADKKAFLQIRRRPGFQALPAQRLVTPVRPRVPLVERHFRPDLLIEETRGLGKDASDQRIRNAVVRDVEEALVETCGAQRLPDVVAPFDVAALQAGDIDDRQAGRGPTASRLGQQIFEISHNGRCNLVVRPTG